MALSGRFLQFSSPKVHPPAPLAPFPPAFIAKGPSAGTPGAIFGSFRRQRSIRQHPWSRFWQHSSPKVQPPAPLATISGAFVAKGPTLSGFLPQISVFLCAFSQSRTAFATNPVFLCAFSLFEAAFATNPRVLCAPRSYGGVGGQKAKEGGKRSVSLLLDDVGRERPARVRSGSL